jgi:hypothetical protein
MCIDGLNSHDSSKGETGMKKDDIIIEIDGP